jgi:hypothetical protein
MITESKDKKVPIHLVQGVHPDAHTQDSGSDSEPELKIAEHETGSESDHDTPISDSKQKYSQDLKNISSLVSTITKHISTLQGKTDSESMAKQIIPLPGKPSVVKESISGAGFSWKWNNLLRH